VTDRTDRRQFSHSEPFTLRMSVTDRQTDILVANAALNYVYVERACVRAWLSLSYVVGLPLLITPPSRDDVDAKRCPVRLPEDDMSRCVT